MSDEKNEAEPSGASGGSVAHDIVDRLRHTVAGSPRWYRNPDGPEAADEIERLREAIRRLAEQDATLSVCDGNVTVDIDSTLTDAEREAVAKAVKDYEDSASTFYERSMHAAARNGMKQAVAMRGLLERLGGER